MISSAQDSREATKDEVSAAGTLNASRETRLKLLVRKGGMRNNQRGSSTAVFKSSMCDGFGVAKARSLSSAQKPIPSFRIFSGSTYARPSEGSAKRACNKLSHIDFEELTRLRRRLIIQRDAPS